jgi:hypothetical protein
MPELSDLRPLLSSNVAQDVANYAGELQYQGNVEDTAGGFVAFAGPTADFILTGVVNGSFSQGPPNPDASIEAAVNPLPYWYGPVVVQGSGWSCTWGSNAAYPSGHSLSISLTNGVADDEVYFEQIVPVAGSYYRAVGDVVRISVVNTGSVACSSRIALQYLTIDGTETGNATSTRDGVAGGATDFDTLFAHSRDTGPPPADVAYLRIRVGLVADGSGTCVLNVTDVRRDMARMWLSVTEQSSINSYAPGLIYQDFGRVNIEPDGGSGERLRVSTSGTIVGSLSVTGNASYEQATIQAGIITPTISANTDDWSPTGLATCSVIFCTVSGGSRNLTGFDATDFTEGQQFILYPTGGNPIVIVNNSGLSSSGNRINGIANANTTILNNSGALFVYAPSVSAATPFRMLLNGGA